MGQPLRDITRIIVKPVFTYSDYSCHYIIRRCGLITQMFDIFKPVRGTKRSNKCTVIVGIMGDSNYTLPQKEAIAYIKYKIEKQIGKVITVHAVEDIESDTPIKLNEKPEKWKKT